MKSRKNILLASVAITALGMTMPASGETVKTQTIVTQQDIPNVQKTDFSAFDLNKDGILSIEEVGEKLFYIFDTDGNEVIDNVEFDNRQVRTLIPMDKQTFVFVDYNDDGRPEKSSYTYDSFIQKSRLARFDNNLDGLSPAEFIGDSFLRLDDDKSKAIELGEWKEAYVTSVLPPVAEQERYQQ